MRIREMTEGDISAVILLYLDHYNGREGGCWTEQTAFKRIHQVVCMEGGYSMLLEEAGQVLGFAMGYFIQYDDVVGYTLEEILIAPSAQNRGLGSLFLEALEETVSEKGAALIEMRAVNDEMHDHFYGKAGYRNAINYVLKVKWL